MASPRATHLGIVLDEFGLLHDFDIPLAAIGLLGDRDADQLGRLVLGIGHGVCFHRDWELFLHRELRARMCVRASRTEGCFGFYPAQLRACPRELPKVWRWGINNRTPPYQVPGYFAADTER